MEEKCSSVGFAGDLQLCYGVIKVSRGVLRPCSIIQGDEEGISPECQFRAPESPAEIKPQHEAAPQCCSYRSSWVHEHHAAALTAQAKAERPCCDGSSDSSSSSCSLRMSLSSIQVRPLPHTPFPVSESVPPGTQWHPLPTALPQGLTEAQTLLIRPLHRPCQDYS